MMNRLSIQKTLGCAIAAAFLAIPALAADPAGVGNFHQVNQQLYRGAQPTEEGFKSLSKVGIKTVIDLRETSSRSEWEKKVVEADGMKYVPMPMSGLNVDQVTKVLAMIQQENAGPFFIHCRRGADRTGTVVAVYRIAHDHWDNTKALEEARTNKMSWVERAMMSYIRGYKAPVVDASAASPATTGTVN